ncbi:OsmC family protein [Thioalkalicoccus limnaeus]|uniref:OsmC family protein n=1 Tax=Thioalkalicoccus limnaeus TaxID=120681 RepID=A0ABV4BFM2_9GAMM
MALTERIEIGFPGGQRVDAELRGFRIQTDQLVEHGGTNAAPQPFDLFLASIATCAGIFALKFCQARNLPTEGLHLRMDWQGHKTDPAAAQAVLRLTLPEGFPDKYRDGIVKAMNQCAVKRTIEQPPRFVTELVSAE